MTPVVEERPYAIVIGLDDIRGVHAARTLARHGVPIIGIGREPKSYGCKTNVCERMVYADTRTEEFVGVLEELASTLKRRATLVPCTDMAALQISRHRHRLEASYPITLPEADVVETLMDKGLFYSFAARVGLPIPKTVFLSSLGDVQLAEESLRFPCAVKPPNSKDPRWLAQTHTKAFKVHNAKELAGVFETWRRWAQPLIAQEWVEGSEENLFACHCYLNVEGDPLVTFTSRKLRQWPLETGQACLAEECRNDDVRAITLELFRQARFRGLGYVEVKREEVSGRYLIVEPNIGRVSGRMALAEAGGVELLYTMYCDSLDLPLPQRREQQYGRAKWVYARQDVQSSLARFRRGQLTVRQWWRTWRGRKTYALLSWRDPRPFVGDILNGVYLMCSPKERRKRSDKQGRALKAS